MDDWLEHPELLPPRPRSYIEEKYKMYFALDRGGMEGCDQFVFIVPNGLAVVGLAPSHALIRAHRQATDYQPLQLQYVPPPQGFIDAAALACMEDGEEGMPQAPLTAGERDAHVQHQGERDAGQEDTSLQQDAATISGQGSHAPAPIKELRPCPSFSAEQLARVNFSSGKHDHSQTKLSGAKRKNQGTWLQPDQVICRVENSTGTSIPVQAVVKGRLLEVNQQLLALPRLLLDRPCREGYIAILQPQATGAALAQALAALTPLEEYLQLRGLSAEDLL